MSKKTTLHVNIDNDVLENYNHAYPRNTRTRLIENLFKIVVNDKILFEKIFFMDLLKHDNNFNL